MFNGSFESKEVAIKQIKKLSFEQNPREVINLIKVLSTDSVDARKGRNCIINFFGCFEDENFPNFYYLVFEKAEMNLKNFLRHDNELKYEITEKDLLRDIAEGVFHIHENQIIHLDLKLENILLVKRNNILQACICDFGTSQAIQKNGTVPFTKEMLGTEVITFLACPFSLVSGIFLASFISGD